MREGRERVKMDRVKKRGRRMRETRKDTEKREREWGKDRKRENVCL